MMSIKPAFEGAELLSQGFYPLGIFNGGIDLESIADDSSIREQTRPVFLCEFCHLFNVEVSIGFAEVVRFL